MKTTQKDYHIWSREVSEDSLESDPEGLTSEASSCPKISVILPVFNGKDILPECLAHIAQSDYPNYEVIVVDDKSTDNSVDICKEHGCKVLISRENNGPATARNFGAREAVGDILFFIDSDVMLQKDTLRLLAESFKKNSDYSGIVGVQTDDLRFKNLASQYKNFWMRYTYEVLKGPTSLFYTSVAAMKREVFMELNGFDINYETPDVEDTDFGQKAAAAGHAILIDKQIQVEHVKRYSLYSMLRTDFYRASSLIKLVFRKKVNTFTEKNKTSVPKSYIFSVPLAYFLLLCFPAFLVTAPIPTAISAFLAAIGIVLLNGRFLTYMSKKRGVLFGIKSMGILAVDLLIVGGGCLHGMVAYMKGDKY